MSTAACSSKVDIITGTLGKALGGASGGFDRQRRSDRAAAPAFAPLPVLQHRGAEHRRRHRSPCWTCWKAAPRCAASSRPTTTYFREGDPAGGFEIKPGAHPIVPVMLFDAVKAQQLSSARLLEAGRLRGRLLLPGGPEGGQARVRVQISAVHEREHLEQAVAAFAQAGREPGLVKHEAALEEDPMTTKILLIGANGQIGSELAVGPAKRHGNANVITSDVAPQGRVPR